MPTDGQTDGQMDMKKPIVALCDCANAPRMHPVFVLKIKKGFVSNVLCCD